ncbi:hypothetical protein OHA25_08195 [Nonomuraea sp. NBC_00507]|uniref:hypothetical protein n=1 Tax=Nonomuraea sp. NBC_00507 TaxID=2976002 RepID=UPI002E18B28B
MTTTALAATLCWPVPVVMAECDPAGGVVLSGMLAGRPDLVGSVGLLQATEIVWEQLIPLDAGGQRRLLPGLSDPGQAVHLDGAWGVIRDLFTHAPFDVIADIGRIGGKDTPYPLLTEAAFVVMVLRPTFRSIAAARPRLHALLRANVQAPVGLCLVGEGPYNKRTVSSVLGLPVLAEIREDHTAAGVLSDGRPARRDFGRSPLMYGAARLVKQMRQPVLEGSPA